MFTLPTWAAAKLFLKSKKFLIPFAIIALLIAVGGGTYFYLNHQKNEAVTAAVTQADSKATIKSYETKDAIATRVIVVDRKFDDLHNRTVKDYANVRTTIETAPVEERDAQAPRLIVDTLNELDRLRASRDESGVPDPVLPVG